MKFVQRKGNDASKGAKIEKKMNSKTWDWFADDADRTEAEKNGKKLELKLAKLLADNADRTLARLNAEACEPACGHCGQDTALFFSGFHRV